MCKDRAFRELALFVLYIMVVHFTLRARVCTVFKKHKLLNLSSIPDDVTDHQRAASSDLLLC